MLIRVEDGFGRPVGSLDVPDQWLDGREIALEYSLRIQHTRNTHSCVVKKFWFTPTRCVPWGWVVCVHWKARDRLRRSGLLLAYEVPPVWDPRQQSEKEGSAK